MSKSDQNLKAYPSSSEQNEKGMTLRDHFAAEALKGILSNEGPPDNNVWRDQQIKQAYMYADKMLIYRKQKI